ncbi:sulfate transporter family protein, partial [Chlamydia psittaci 84-8471/1]
LMDMG